MTTEFFMYAVVGLLAFIASLLWLVTTKLDEVRDATQSVQRLLDNKIFERKSADTEGW